MLDRVPVSISMPKMVQRVCLTNPIIVLSHVMISVGFQLAEQKANRQNVETT